MRILFALLLSSALPLAACQAQPQAQTTPAAKALVKVPLVVASTNGTHKFTVEVAATPEQQETGMMFRTATTPNAGMIFPFPAPKMASFWMKNTLIPLDIIFIRADGTIANIADNAVPQSLDMVLAAEPVTAVLEIAGGRAAELGINPGDKVTWQSFAKR